MLYFHGNFIVEFPMGSMKNNHTVGLNEIHKRVFNFKQRRQHSLYAYGSSYITYTGGDDDDDDGEDEAERFI